MNRARLILRCSALLLVAGVGAAACSNDTTAPTATVAAPTPLVVTSVKGDPASALLAAVYSRVLEDAGFTVARRDPVALDRAGYLAEVDKGTIDVIPDWSGDLMQYLYSLPSAPTAPTTVVPTAPATTEVPYTFPTTTTLDPNASTTTADPNATTTEAATTTVDTTTTTVDTTTTTSGATTSTGAGETIDPNATTTTTLPPGNGRGIANQVEAIKSALTDGVTVSGGMAAQKRTELACTNVLLNARIDTLISSDTNLASVAPTIRLGASAAWQTDAVAGLPAFTLFYGGTFGQIVTLPDDDAGIQKAIDDKSVDCLAISTMSTVLTTARLTMLVDDQTMLPANAALAVLSKTTENSVVSSAIETVGSSLTSEKLNQMLAQVAAGADPAVVANAFIDTLPKPTA